jgi:hypothetical protein
MRRADGLVALLLVALAATVAVLAVYVVLWLAARG